MLALLILLPLLGLILMNLPLNGLLKKLALGYAMVLSAGQIVLAIAAGGPWLSKDGLLANYLHLNLTADDLTRVMLVCIGVVVFIALLLARPMVAAGKTRFNFASVILIAMIGMNGMVMLQDIFSLYVFLEVTSVASFILIASTRTKPALEGAFKYLILSAVATTLMLAGIALLMLAGGSTDFGTLRQIVAGNGNVIGKIALAAFACGLFVKGGMVPFHGWLPDAYSQASAPVSVLLAGIVTKVSGIYLLIRLVGGFDLTFSLTGNLASMPALNHLLLALGAVSVVVGAVAALGQNDMKRLLAYSSISQVGYIILGLGTGTQLGLWGAIFHLFNHSIFKSLLFVNAAAVEQQLGTTDMSRAGGLGGKMPYTGATSIVGILSTAGVPPLSGFWSKLIIIVALWTAGFYVYAGIAVALSVVTLGYLLTMQRRVFFGKLGEGLEQTREATPAIVAAAVVLALITLGVGVAPFFGSVMSSLGLAVAK